MQRNRVNQKKGFSLLELMIVVVVISILASIGLVRYGKTVERSRMSEAQSVLGAIRAAQFRYATEHSKFTADLSDFDINFSSEGVGNRFFDFIAAPGGADPFNGVDDVIAQATRNSIQAGAFGSDSNCVNYVIYLNESGNFSSLCPGANSFLQ